jgi:hypothetical protein
LDCFGQVSLASPLDEREQSGSRAAEGESRYRNAREKREPARDGLSVIARDDRVDVRPALAELLGRRFADLAAPDVLRNGQAQLGRNLGVP